MHGHFSLADALFTKTQQRLLVLPFGQPSRSFFTTELIELTGSGAVQRELKHLTSSGLVNVTLIGKRKHYQADRVPTIRSRIPLTRESIVFNRPRIQIAGTRAEMTERKSRRTLGHSRGSRAHEGG